MSHPVLAAITTTPTIKTKLEKHVQEWGHCQRCRLCKDAATVVLGRGTLPCDVLFVGEAPGPDEDKQGVPFIGRSGNLLNNLIDDSKRLLKTSHYKCRWNYTYAITNVVACIPTTATFAKSTARKNFREPTGIEISSCAPRLQQFVQLAAPRSIVLLGRIAKIFSTDTVLSIFPKEKQPPLHTMYHPSYILRLGGYTSPAYKTWLRGLTQFLSETYKSLPRK